ncbi:MAG: nucleotide exchange factor GrpE [Candidatus Riflebacteria bacterium]|nr:nucleotide exchange factor GrpE [Candidatus Riflebacteria bacterium]
MNNFLKEKILDLVVLLKTKSSILKRNNSTNENLKEIDSLLEKIQTINQEINQEKHFEDDPEPDLKESQDQIQALRENNKKIEKSLIEELYKKSQLEEQNKQNSKLIESLTAHSVELKIEKKDLLIKVNSLEEELKKKEGSLISIEMEGFQRAASKFQPKVNELQENLFKLQAEAQQFNNEKKILEEKLSFAKMQTGFFQEKVRDFELKNKSLKEELIISQNQPPRGLPEDKERIIELEKGADLLRKQILSSNLGEIEQNITSSFRAKIDFLEKQNQKLSKEMASHDTIFLESQKNEIKQLTENNARLNSKNKELEKKLGDILARFDNFASEKIFDKKIEIASDELVSFFYFFQDVQSQIPNSPEIIEIQKKILEIFQLYEMKGHFKKIPSLGLEFNPKIHIPVKCFFSDVISDKIIIKEVNSGFEINGKVVKKGYVWVSQNSFLCGSCGVVSRNAENFCSGCGKELFAVDEKTSRKKMTSIPEDFDLQYNLTEKLFKNGQKKSALAIIEKLKAKHKMNPKLQEFLRENNLIDNGEEDGRKN